jgi:hypothetical protein
MWFIHDNTQLQDKIKSFVDFPIATNLEGRQPRLLVFSVDILEGETVTFDIYPKADGSRKSEYGKLEKKSAVYKHVIKYPGVTIEHVMASGTLPEFYDYAKVPINQSKESENLDTDTKQDKKGENNNVDFGTVAC